MRLIFSLLIALSFLQTSAQSLTKEETVIFLNELSAKFPVKWDDKDDSNLGIGLHAYAGDDLIKFFQIVLNENGKIEINRVLKVTNIKDPTRNKEEKKYEISFNVESFKLEDIELDYINSEILLKGYQYIGQGSSVLWKSYISINSKPHLRVYYNGLKYLISQLKLEVDAQNKITVEDPFANQKQDKLIPRKDVIILSKGEGVSFVHVTLGKKSVKFILDSGADDCSISDKLESELLKNGDVKKSDYLPNGLYKLADGSIVECRRFKINKMKVGTTVVSNVVVSVGSEDAPNLLGQSFLKKLKRWTIDNDKGVLIIE
ncbi:MAG: retroviral-like aspartic protease family protein [Chitinophagaceae bacterium]|nr:retroviral-like aspartic protease family protein [Chitinophagaceae bacterium]